MNTSFFPTRENTPRKLQTAMQWELTKHFVKLSWTYETRMSHTQWESYKVITPQFAED
jgi:hypothetical protein